MNYGKVQINISYICFFILLITANAVLIMCSLDKKGINPNTSPFIWASLAVFLSFIMDRVLIMLSRSLKINTNLQPNDGKNDSKLYAILHITFSIFLLVVVIYFSGKFLRFWYETLFPPNRSLVYSPQFLGLLLGYVFYIMVRLPLKYFLSFISSKSAKIFKLPTYRLINDGVEINFNMVDLSDSSKQYSAFLHFKDIERMQILTYMDALSYYRYQIKPDLRIQAMRNSAMFAKKQPDYYITQPVGNGINIVIEGKNLFYFMSFQTEDVTDLVEAYKLFKVPVR